MTALKWCLRMKIKQVWTPYTEWEDFKNGMWRKPPAQELDELLSQAIEFTGDHNLYGQAMKNVVFLWERTMLNSLTNPSINQRAFVGHCACCYAISMPESITRAAWKYLTVVQQYNANLEAQKAIDSWKIWHYNKRQLKIPFLEYEETVP